jgi:hypothetical protein
MATGLSKGRIIYHKGAKYLRLKTTDHALVFRADGDGGLRVFSHVGTTKEDNPTTGGLLVGTIGMNLFDKEFVQRIDNQLQMMATGAMKDG